MLKQKRKSNSYGFSKYTQDGLVTYSESKDYYGKVIKHFYDYDSSGRRIYYAQKQQNEENNIVTLMEEFTQYKSNGSKTIITKFYKENTIAYRYIDSYGKEIKSSTIDINTGLTIEKEFDGYKGYINRQYISLCIPQL